MQVTYAAMPKSEATTRREVGRLTLQLEAPDVV